MRLEIDLRTLCAGFAALMISAAVAPSSAAQERRLVPEPAKDPLDDRWKTHLVQELQPAEGVERLSVSSGVGSIVIAAGAGEHVRIEATVKADRDVPAGKLTEVFEHHVGIATKGNGT